MIDYFSAFFMVEGSSTIAKAFSLFYLQKAILINEPLITALWASHKTTEEITEVSLVIKKLFNCGSTSSTNS